MNKIKFIFIICVILVYHYNVHCKIFLHAIAPVIWRNTTRFATAGHHYKNIVIKYYDPCDQILELNSKSGNLIYYPYETCRADLKNKLEIPMCKLCEIKKASLHSVVEI